MGPLLSLGWVPPVSPQCSLNGPRCSTPFRGFSSPPAQRQAPEGVGAAQVLCTGLLPSSPDPASAPFTCFPGRTGSPPPWVPPVSSSCHSRCPSPARCSHSLLTSAPSHRSLNLTSLEIPVWPFRPGTSPLRPVNLPWQRSSLGTMALLALGWEGQEGRARPCLCSHGFPEPCTVSAQLGGREGGREEHPLAVFRHCACTLPCPCLAGGQNAMWPSPGLLFLHLPKGRDDGKNTMKIKGFGLHEPDDHLSSSQRCISRRWESPVFLAGKEAFLEHLPVARGVRHLAHMAEHLPSLPHSALTSPAS